MTSGVRVVRFGALGLACQIGASGRVAAAPLPELEPIKLTGIVRDFRQGHVDFDVVPQGGYGHYAGNIGLNLGDDGRPVFVGGGYRVDEEWFAPYQQIAPHMAAGDPGTVRLALAPVTAGGSTVDTWDSAQGDYGGGNSGPAPAFQVGAAMPQLSPPGGLGPNAGDLVSWPSEFTIDQDVHCNRFIVGDNRTMRISGDVTIYAEQEFKLQDHVEVELLPGAALSVYTGGTVQFSNGTRVNQDGANPSRLSLHNLGAGDVYLHQDARFYGRVTSPQGRLVVFPGAGFLGAFTGKTVWVAGGGGLHIDVTPPRDACGEEIHDLAGVAGPASSGGIDSAETFGEWYHDIPGTNLSKLLTITLVDNRDGGWGYIEESFYPIDDQLFGNEGHLHNTLFTFELEASFVYDACADQMVGFEGSDDFWLFVDDQLVMDLGGVEPGTPQWIHMDRLGLVPGQLYTMNLFFAQRQTLKSAFRLKTNIPLLGDTQVATLTEPFD